MTLKLSIFKGFLFIFSVCLLSCNKIQPGEELSAKEIAHIQRYGLLDSGEHIIQFYSQGTVRRNGNFYTDKRVAAYWLDNDNTKNEVNSAYYQDIAYIDTVYNVGLTYAPYMRITLNDSSTFKVYAEGEKPALDGFFAGAIGQWNKVRQSK